MDIIFTKENYRPSHLLALSGIGIMVASETIQVKPIQSVVRGAGTMVALGGVVTSLAEQAIFKKP